jgi:hypothetical protein
MMENVVTKNSMTKNVAIESCDQTFGDQRHLSHHMVYGNRNDFYFGHL